MWEPTLVNLGHALRKQGQHEQAIVQYEHALGLCPTQAGTYTALGYTHQLMGNSSAAVEYYHKALGLRPDDTFAAEMLAEALKEECHKFSQSVDSIVPQAL